MLLALEQVPLVPTLLREVGVATNLARAVASAVRRLHVSRQRKLVLIRPVWTLVFLVVDHYGVVSVARVEVARLGLFGTLHHLVERASRDGWRATGYRYRPEGRHVEGKL